MSYPACTIRKQVTGAVLVRTPDGKDTGLARRPRGKVALNPRVRDENFEWNLRIADEVAAVAADAGATPAQVAVAWVLSKGDDIVPIPGTKRTARVEENCAADGTELSPEQIRRLDNFTAAACGHHEEQMRLLER